jgi:hypothetical protein
MAKQISDPPESYITEIDGVFHHVTEYTDDDLVIDVKFESAAEKLGYLVLYHAVTLDTRLSHGAFRLYCLYHYWARRKTSAYPSLKTVGDHLGVSRSSVVAYNKELEEYGYISRHGRKSTVGDQLSSVVVLKSLEKNAGASAVAAKILIGERDVEFREGGGQPAEQVVSQLVEGGQPVGHEGLTIEELTNKEKKKRLADRKAPASLSAGENDKQPLPIEEGYRVEYYVGDDENVDFDMGRKKKGPWRLYCPNCQGKTVTVEKMDSDPTPCSCGMHEFVLLSKKPHKKVQGKHPAVDAYYRIAAAKVRYGALAEWEAEIAAVVGVDEERVEHWRRVVKAACANQQFNVRNVPNLLKYMSAEYMDVGKMPGDRDKRKDTTADKPVKQQEEDGSITLVF